MMLSAAEIQFEMDRTDSAVHALEGMITSCRMKNESLDAPSRVSEELRNLNENKARAAVIHMEIIYNSLYQCPYSAKIIKKCHYMLAQWQADLGNVNKAYVHAIAAFVIDKSLNRTDYFSAMLAAQALTDMGRYSFAKSIYKHLRALNLAEAINTHLLASEKRVDYLASITNFPRRALDAFNMPPAVMVAALEYWISAPRVNDMMDNFADVLALDSQPMRSKQEVAFNFKYQLNLFKPPDCFLIKNVSKYEIVIDIVRSSSSLMALGQRNSSDGFHMHERKQIAFLFGTLQMAQQLYNYSREMSKHHSLLWKDWFQSAVQWRDLSMLNDRLGWIDQMPNKYRKYLGGLSTLFFKFGSFNRKYKPYIFHAVRTILNGLLMNNFEGGKLYVARDLNDGVNPGDVKMIVVPTVGQRSIIKNITDILLTYSEDSSRAEMALRALYEALTALGFHTETTSLRLLFFMSCRLAFDGPFETGMGAIIEIELQPQVIGTPTLRHHMRHIYVQQALERDLSAELSPLDFIKLSLIAPIEASREAVLKGYLQNAFDKFMDHITIGINDLTTSIEFCADLLFYWYILNPLNRGSAMLGYMALSSMLLSIGVDISIHEEIRSMLAQHQLDLEALFSSDVSFFRRLVVSIVRKRISEPLLVTSAIIVARTSPPHMVSDLFQTPAEMIDLFNCMMISSQ